MFKQLLSVIIPSIMLYSCSYTTKPNENLAEGLSQKPLMAMTQTTPAMIPSEAGIVRMNIVDGKGKIKVQKKKDQTVYIEFESKGYKNVSAQLFSMDSLANIRFSQIILPNGSQDGPFGRELKYRTTKDGIYKISVHENMMAGDPWGGTFDVEVSLTK
ncbi:hypothetical protein [Prevotella sp. 10(H)]|uniref:hypothetical protein n=1 Tax=Prevotella sp. 10(H) TaxID=1158294 RepID=UPI0004A6FA72|nr:hypothetical protein [Prevotella sp. 10(H)]